MNKLITSTKAKGSDAYHGTQQSAVCSPRAATTSNSAGPSSSSTPLDILSSSSSSKRRFSQFDISAQSSSSLKRNKPSEKSEDTIALIRLVHAVLDLREKVRNIIEPEPEPAPTRACLTPDQLKAMTNAIQRLVKSTRADHWLSNTNTAKMMCIFQRDVSAVNAYLAVASDEIAMRSWVLLTLGLVIL
jgi:hypothetical protein